MRKCFLFIPVFLLLMLCVSCKTGIQEPANSSNIYYESYKDIPKVTAQDIESIEAIKSARSSLTVGMLLSTESFRDCNGELKGYTVLLTSWLSELFGIDFELEIYEWDELNSNLESYELDFTGDLSKTHERLNSHYMTSTIAERSINIYRLEGSEELERISQKGTLKYAFLQNSTSYKNISKYSSLHFEPIFVQEISDIPHLLRSGEVDAFFAECSLQAAFNNYPEIYNYNYLPAISIPVSLSTCNPQLKPIIDVLDKYIDSVGPGSFSGMYEEGTNQYLHNKLQTSLSQADRDYLIRTVEAGEPIKIGAEVDNYPFCFWNINEGEWQGIAIDVLNEISEISGLSFKIMNTTDTTWSELQDMLDNGEISLVTSLIPTASRENKYLWPENPYCVDHYALISHMDMDNLTPSQVYNHKVGILKDSVFEEVFNNWYPNHPDTVVFDTTAGLFDALDRGELELVLSSRGQMLSLTHYSEKPYFKTNLLMNGTFLPTFGLNAGEEQLRNIIDKSQNLIDTAAISEDWMGRTYDYRSQVNRARIPLLITVAILLTIVSALSISMVIKGRRFNANLEKQVLSRTAELEIQTEAAKVASRAKSDFLSRMSHEIRTPLNAITGMAQIARQIPGQPEKSCEAIGEILTASDHLMGIINDILDMSKIEAGKFSLVNDPFILSTAMDEVAKIVSQRCNANDINFIVEQDISIQKPVIGDRLRLKQVLINLLGNAVKFNIPGGKVWLIIREMEQDDDSITISFSVADDGIGMTSAEVSRLFTPFEQAKDEVAVKYGGTGLGLAISQNLVQMMGGEIKVNSTPGEGSEFYFSIKMQKSDMELQDSPLLYAAPDLLNKRILLAEDVHINRIIVTELLADTRASIDEAEDGEKAVEMFRSSPPGYFDLIFMDIQMPIKNGYEAAEEIRSLDRWDAKTIPIIAMTANAYQEDIQKAKERGMNGHISKPVDVQLIYKALWDYLISPENI